MWSHAKACKTLMTESSGDTSKIVIHRYSFRLLFSYIESQSTASFAGLTPDPLFNFLIPNPFFDFPGQSSLKLVLLPNTINISKRHSSYYYYAEIFDQKFKISHLLIRNPFLKSIRTIRRRSICSLLRCLFFRCAGRRLFSTAASPGQPGAPDSAPDPHHIKCFDSSCSLLNRPRDIMVALPNPGVNSVYAKNTKQVQTVQHEDLHGRGNLQLKKKITSNVVIQLLYRRSRENRKRLTILWSLSTFYIALNIGLYCYLLSILFIQNFWASRLTADGVSICRDHYWICRQHGDHCSCDIQSNGKLSKVN